MEKEDEETGSEGEGEQTASALQLPSRPTQRVPVRPICDRPHLEGDEAETPRRVYRQASVVGTGTGLHVDSRSEEETDART